MAIIPHDCFGGSAIPGDVFLEDICLVLTLRHEVVILQAGIVNIKTINSGVSFIKNCHDST